MKPNAPTLEQRCPACDGLFTISSASRKKKVQCPQCRAVVTPTDPNEVKQGREADAVPAPPEWVARCDMLQARIETLEQQVEALMVSPRTPLAPIRERFRNVSPKSRDHRLHPDPPRSRDESPQANEEQPSEAFRPEPPPAESVPREMFKRSFERPPPEIGLYVNAGDAEARQVAESLTETLASSGWKVRGVSEDAALAEGRFGVTLAASSTLPLQMVTGTLNALSAAGLAVTLQFDPERGTNESILIVGITAEAEDEAQG
jgi:hypothetical protein